MSSRSRVVIIGLLIGFVGIILVPITIGLEEDIGLGLSFKLRGAREAPSDVIIVTMDKISSDNLKLPTEPEKWPRSLHARLIENLVKEGIAVMAFDIFFEESTSKEDDDLFAKAIRNAGNVVLCDCIKRETIPFTDKGGTHKGNLNIERVVQPIPLFQRSALALAPFPLPKVPVKVSQYWMIKTGAGDAPTLPVVIFQIFMLEVYDEFIQLLKKVSLSQAAKLPSDKDVIIKNKGVKELIRLLRGIFKDKPFIAQEMLEELSNSRFLSNDTKKRQLLISLIKMYQGPDSRFLNFYGPPGTITTIPYFQLIQRPEQSTLPEKQVDWRGKAVFVGLSERLRPEQKDGFHTVFSQSSGIDISGVEIAATAFANLLEAMPIQPLGRYVCMVFILVWGMLLGVLCVLFPTFIAAMSVMGLSILYLITAQYQFNTAGVWYPIVVPLFFQLPLAFLVTLLWKNFYINKERQNIRKAFGYYLPDRVVDQLAKNMGDIKVGGQILYGTCLSTDAEQYTTLSETMDPEELSNFMNKYYEFIFEPIKQRRGIVSDIIGDSMLAIWATANPDTALRNQACLAALDIERAVDRFNQSTNTEKNLPTRIGLHSGQMRLGNIGAIDHYEYRPVGDIVNTVSRIETLNKTLGTRILVSEDVLYQVDGLLTRELGKFLLFGKSKPTMIHQLICRSEDCNGQQKAICNIFPEVLCAFRKQSWEDAIKILNESIRICEEDGPSRFYLDLCQKYRKDPPGEMWDGIVRMDIK